MTKIELQGWVDLICYGLAYGGMLVYLVWEIIRSKMDESKRAKREK